MKENSFFAGIRRSGWVRPDNRWIGGVCAELARKSGWDVSLIRGIAVVLAIFFWIPIALYGVAWLLLPDARTGQILAEDLVNGQFEIAQVGAISAIVVGLVNPWPYGSGFWIVGLLICGGIAVAIIAVKNSTDAAPGNSPGTPPPDFSPKGPPPMSYTPPTPQPQRPPTPPVPPRYPTAAMPPQAPPPPAWRPPALSSAVGLAVMGLLFLVGAGMVISSSLGFGLDSRSTTWMWAAWCALSLLAMGFTLAISALRGRRGGWFLGLSIVTSLVVFPVGMATASWVNHSNDYWYGINVPGIAEALSNTDLSGMTGDFSYDHNVSYIDVSASNVTLDLTKAPKNFQNDIYADLDASNLTILVRPDQQLAISADAAVSNFSTEGINVAQWGLDQVARSGSFDWYIDSPTPSDDSGLYLSIDADFSNVTLREVSPVSTPQSGAGTSQSGDNS